jgi:thiamine-monophosphate kinase
MALGEFELIDRYFRRPPRAGGPVVLGVGDDCALLAPGPGMQLAISTDALVEGRHFLSTVSPRRLGHKCLAVNLSDLAACGARPLGFTLSLSLPAAREEFLAPFAEGLLALADAHGVELVGGDTTAGPLNIGITVLGEVPPGQALLRSGARPGDDIWVSGTLGDARLALEAFRGSVTLSGEAFEATRQAMELPQPRVALGQALRGVASAAIDLSDGLLGDLGHVLRRSEVGAEVEWARLPRSPWLAAQTAEVQAACLLSGGDDYELLFTAPADAAAAVLAAGAQAGVTVCTIGRVVALNTEGINATDGTQAGSASTIALRVLDTHGRPLDVQRLRAFDHFKP